MKRSVPLIILLLSFSIFPLSAFGQSAGQIRFSVVDKTGMAVSRIAKEDLSLFEGNTQLTITGIEPVGEKPIAAVFLIDNSISQEAIFSDTKKVAVSIVRNAFQKTDTVAVLKFSDYAEEVEPFTQDIERATAAINKIQLNIPAGYIGGGIVSGVPSGVPRPVMGTTSGTNLWDSLFLIGERDFSRLEGHRKIVVLLTDGVDTEGKRSISDAIASLSKAGISVYAVGLGDDYYSGIDKNNLKKIAEGTGGRTFFVTESNKGKKQANDLSDIDLLKERFKSEYLLKFTVNGPVPKKPGKLRLQIVSADKEKQALVVSHPQGYVTVK